MQKFLVFKSLWAMERRQPDGQEWALEEKLTMIRDAGFDGASVDFKDYGYAKQCTDFLRENGMSWQVEIFLDTVDDLKPIVERVKELGGDHINLLARAKPYTLEEGVAMVYGWRQIAEDAGIPLHIETHRDNLTTDLIYTLHLLDCLPDLRLTGDVSHYVVAREFSWPISEENHRMIRRILDHCWGFQGRVASREQIQLQISFPQHKDWVDLFMGWWEYGFRSWRKRAPEDATLTFLCELGPKEYAMTGPDGYELSDRWQEALMLKDMIRALWQRIEDEEKADSADSVTG